MEKREVALRTQEGLVEIAKEFVNSKGGEIVLPPNYDVNNAVKNLYLKCLDLKDKDGRPALETCTQQSIRMTVQNMVSKGLDPSKNQCYPIVRGNALTLHIGAFGNMKQAMSLSRIKINSDVVHEGDKVSIEKRTNGTQVIHHETNWVNLSKPIIGAYAVAVNMDSGDIDNSDIMTMDEIKKSWLKSSSKNLQVHTEFGHEMSRKTVESRLAKRYVYTSDDSNKIEVYDSEGNRITAENNYDYLKTQKIDAEESIENEETVIIVDDESEVATDTKVDGEVLEDLPDLEPTTEETETPSGEVVEISYKEYINNKEKYELVKGSYDSATKKCKVVAKG